MKYKFIVAFLLTTFSVKGQSYTSPASFSFTNSSNNTSFTTKYILVNTSTNLIAYSSITTSFSSVTTGNYSLYAVNYDPSGTAPTLTIGTAFSAIGGSCVATSTAVSVTVSASTSQTFTAPASFSFANSSNNTSYTTIYILVNSSTNLIAYSSTSTSFSGVGVGTYSLYAVNYDPSQTAPTLTVGTVLSAMGGSCVATSGALTVIVYCGDNPTLSNYTSGTTTITASTTINATNTVSSGANVTYQAGNVINLNAGFAADLGSIFVAQIGGCNN